MHPVIQLLDKQCFLNNHVPVLVVQKIVKFFFFLRDKLGLCHVGAIICDWQDEMLTQVEMGYGCWGP